MTRRIQLAPSSALISMDISSLTRLRSWKVISTRADETVAKVVFSRAFHTHVMRPVERVVWPVTDAYWPSNAGGVSGVTLFCGLLIQ